ncbi:MAG: hypothetical protein OXT74_19385 [Candidatus Poribacteria bacterium]|nr:hypothetical protein [Candidatus Poribacteria bacterium]
MLLRLCILMIGSVMAIGLFIEAEAQQFAEDVVYLKNGSVVRGIIVEQIPNETLKIRTQGGSEFVFTMDDVLKITKELPVIKPPPGSDPVPSSTYIDQKDPLVAFLLSFLLVGTGQYYVEAYEEAYTHWGVAVVSFALLFKALEDNNGYDRDDDDAFGYVGLLVGSVNWVISMISAPLQAHTFNSREHHRQSVSLVEDRLLLESYSSGKAEGAMLSLRF